MRTAACTCGRDAVGKMQTRGILDEIAPQFTKAQKARVVAADDSATEYQLVYDENRRERYDAASQEFGRYLGTHGIFVRPEIRERLFRRPVAGARRRLPARRRPRP